MSPARREVSRYRLTALFWCVVLALMAPTRPAFGWIENTVLGAEVRLEVDSAGKALVEQRITLKSNGSERLKEYVLEGIDRDAVPEANSYVVPARDAVSSSLDSAIPLTMEVVNPKPSGDRDAVEPSSLRLRIDDRKGLRRGSYLLVVRYRTDLRARDLFERDGAMVRLAWTWPVFADGFDNGRVTFSLPHAPTPPRGAGAALDADGDDGSAPTYLTEVRKGSEQDEIELLRPYVPQGEAVTWIIRMDPRAIEPLPREEQETGGVARVGAAPTAAAPWRREILLGAGGALFLLCMLLVWLKGREVAKLATAARAEMPPLVPLPAVLRAVLAAAALVGGVALQLLVNAPLWGALLVVSACLLAAHGGAKLPERPPTRGPGRWLVVTEQEGLPRLPPSGGAYLDSSTRVGKLLLLLLLVATGAVVFALAREGAPQLAILVAFDAVIWLAIFGTGRLLSLPPDMAVEPVRILRPVAERLRKHKAMKAARLVPRLRIPHGEMDPDEVRLMVFPRLPLRGFVAIEVGVTYALGLGARVAMPEVLVRVLVGSPCDDALAAISRRARITPGRKREERVISLSPRWPSAKMTAALAAALAARVTDVSAPRVRPAPAAASSTVVKDEPPSCEPPPTAAEGAAASKPKRRRRAKGREAA